MNNTIPDKKRALEAERIEYYKHPSLCACGCGDIVGFLAHKEGRRLASRNCHNKHRKVLCQAQHCRQESPSPEASTIPIPRRSPELEPHNPPPPNELLARPGLPRSRRLRPSRPLKTPESSSLPILSGETGSRQAPGSDRSALNDGERAPLALEPDSKEPRRSPYGPRGSLIYKQQVAYVHRVWLNLRSLRKAGRLLGIDKESVRQGCLAHERMLANGTSFYWDGRGWEMIRKKQESTLTGDLLALRAEVALMKLACYRAGLQLPLLASEEAVPAHEKEPVHEDRPR